MNSLAVVALVLSFTICVGAGGPRRHPNMITDVLFPKCASFVDAMENKGRELFDQDKIGYQACGDEEEDEVCMKRDTQLVRCDVSDMPSDECLAQIMAYLKGETCNE